jgi:predicted membrane protein
MLTHSQSAVYPVLMETIAPVGTAEIGAIHTVYLLAPLLGHGSLGSVNWMVVVEPSDDLGSINNLRPIEGYAEINR